MNKLLLLVSSAALAACVSAPPPATSTSASQPITRDACPASVPAALAPAVDQDLAFVLDAQGFQDYTCQATATGFAWAFVAPDADLYLQHEDDTIVGHHFAGPTWEYEDGSFVVAAKQAAAQPDKSAVPWLLLVAVSHGGDDGRMTPVTSIQRLVTVGGIAPASGCDAAHTGQAAAVAYTASYYFYVTRNGHKDNNVRCGAD
ncbi:MAG: DUF3455 domain-containing protein [Acidobacteriota bacterium]